MRILEIEWEIKLGVWCINQGIDFRKLKLASESAWPDRTLFYRGQFMVIECKREGERPTPLQQYTLDRMSKQGTFACWSDNLEHAKNLISQWRTYVDHCGPAMEKIRQDYCPDWRH